MADHSKTLGVVDPSNYFGELAVADCAASPPPHSGNPARRIPSTRCSRSASRFSGSRVRLSGDRKIRRQPQHLGRVALRLRVVAAVGVGGASSACDKGEASEARRMAAIASSYWRAMKCAAPSVVQYHDGSKNGSIVRASLR